MIADGLRNAVHDARDACVHHPQECAEHAHHHHGHHYVNPNAFNEATKTEGETQVERGKTDSGATNDGKSASASVKGSIEKVSDKQLEKLGIDAHELKKDFLGKKAKISEYDIYKNKDTGELELYKKGGKGEGIRTGEFFK